MSKEDRFTAEEVEQLRLKFRREALRACEEAAKKAQQEGFELAEKEISELKQEKDKWKAVAESIAVGTNSQQQRKPVVKYIMQNVIQELFSLIVSENDVRTLYAQIYEEVKRTLAENNTDSLNVTTIKSTLLKITENLNSSLPRLVMMTDENEVTTPITPLVSTAPRTTGLTINKNQIIGANPDSDGILWRKRPTNLLISPMLYPLCLQITINIPYGRVVTEAATSSLFSGSTSYMAYNITYDIETTALPPSANGVNSERNGDSADSSLLSSRVISGAELHRFKDFESLFASLRKQYSNALIPPLPKKDITGAGGHSHHGSGSSGGSMGSTADIVDLRGNSSSIGDPISGLSAFASSGDTTSGEQVKETEVRRRQLLLWLKYLSLHNQLQTSTDFLQFLLHNSPQVLNQLSAYVTSNQQRRAQQASSQAGSDDNSTTYAWKLTDALLQQVDAVHQNTNSATSGELSKPSLAHTSSVTNAMLDANIIFEGTAPAVTAPNSLNVGSAGRFSQQSSALSSPIPTPSSTTGMATHAQPKYSDVVRNLSSRQLHTVIRDYEQLQPHIMAIVECTKNLIVSLELQYTAVDDLLQAVKDISNLEKMNPVVSSGAIKLREVQCWDIVKNALNNNVYTDSCEAVIGTISAYMYEPFTFFGSQCLPQAKQLLNSTCNLLMGSNERVEASLKTAQEWRMYRGIRHSVLLQYLVQSIASLMFEKQKQWTGWRMSQNDFVSTKPSEVDDADLNEPIPLRKTLSSRPVSLPSIPTLEELKEATNAEISKLDERFKRLNESFEAAKNRSKLSASAGTPTAAAAPTAATLDNEYHLSKPIIAPGMRHKPTLSARHKAVIVDDAAAKAPLTEEEEPQAGWNVSDYQFQSDYFDRPSLAENDADLGGHNSDGRESLTAGTHSKRAVPHSRTRTESTPTAVAAENATATVTPAAVVPEPRPSMFASLMNKKVVRATALKRPTAAADAPATSSTPAKPAASTTSSGSEGINSKSVAHVAGGPTSSAPAVTPVKSQPSSHPATTSHTATKASSSSSYQWSAVPSNSTPAKAAHGNPVAPAASNKPIQVNTDATPASAPQRSNPTVKWLQDGWQEILPADGGRVYYYNTSTGVTTWDKPLFTSPVPSAPPPPPPHQGDNSARQSSASVGDGDTEIQAIVKGEIKKWLYPRGTNVIIGARSSGMASFIELLNSLPNLLVTLNDNCNFPKLSLTSPPAEVKKTYMKIVRIIHPDKLPSSTDSYTKLLAQESFIVLSQQYDIYRKQYGI